MDKQEERKAAIERLIKKTELIAKNCKNLTYDLMFCDTHGDELTRMTDCNKELSKEEKMEILKDGIESSLDMYPKTYSVVGFVGPYTPKTSRTDIKEIIGYDLVEKSEDEENIVMPVPPTVKQSQRQQTSVNDTDYTGMSSEFYQILGGILDVPGLAGFSNIKDQQTVLAMKMQEFRMKNDMQVEKLNGIISDDNKTIAELKAKLEILERKCEKLEKDCDRQKKYIETMRPKVEEANKLKTKQGQIGALAGTVLSQMAINMLGNSKYGSLLGFGQDAGVEQEQDQQIPQQQPQQVDMESEQNYDVEPVTEE